jgi:branched-chain amino acid transport system substrate-binding protein
MTSYLPSGTRPVRAQTYRFGRRRLATAGVVLLAAVGMVSACSSSGGSGGSTASGTGGGSGAASSSGDYVIGAELPLSGSVAVLGQDFSAGMTAYVNAINASGGVNGHKIRVVQLDDANTPTQGVSAVKRLLSQYKVTILAGGTNSTVAVAYAPLAAAAKTTALLNVPTDQLVEPPLNPYLFGVGGAIPADEAPLDMTFAKSLLTSVAKPKVAILYHVSAAANVWASDVKAAAQQLGWTVTTTQSYQPGATNLSAQASAIAASKPDLVLASPDAAVGLFLKAVLSDGYTGPIVSAEAGGIPSSLESTKYPNFYVGSELAFSNGTAAGVQTYVSAVKSVGGDLGGLTTPWGYMQALVATAAFKACGWPCDPSKISSILEGMTSIDSGGLVVAKFGFTPTNHEAQNGEVLYKWNPGTNVFDVVGSGTVVTASSS